MSERLWAPWRIGFLTAEKPPGCFLCEHSQQSNDAGNYLLHRGKRAQVCLNAYPYTAGHLLVAPYRHADSLTALQPEEWQECTELVRRWTGLLQTTLKPEGFNIGINQGKAAGAALADHLHIHIVPRWLGDVNFISVVSDMRVIHQSLGEVYTMLSEANR